MPRRATVHSKPKPQARGHTPYKVKGQDNRTSASERGYDHTWHKLRQRKIKTNPLCEQCLAQGKTVPAQDVDHINPINGMGDPLRLQWDNLQSLCRTCHNRKTAGQSRPGKAYPEWMPTPNIPVNVVCGPPGSGKTYYARTHAGRNDEIVDLDCIACELSGHDGHDWDRKWLGAALRERNRRIADWSRKRSGCGWLVVTAPHPQQRDWWRDKLGASVVVMETPADKCARNAQADARLSDKLRLKVAQWWELYQRDDRDNHVGPQAGGGINP